MLGFASRSLHIQQSRNYSHAYNDMLFYVLLGGEIIFIGDLISLYLGRGLAKA